MAGFTPGHVSPTGSDAINDALSGLDRTIQDEFAERRAAQQGSLADLDLGDVSSYLGDVSPATIASTENLYRPSYFEMAQEMYGDVAQPPVSGVPVSAGVAQQEPLQMAGASNMQAQPIVPDENGVLIPPALAPEVEAVEDEVAEAPAAIEDETESEPIVPPSPPSNVAPPQKPGVRIPVNPELLPPDERWKSRFLPKSESEELRRLIRAVNAPTIPGTQPQAETEEEQQPAVEEPVVEPDENEGEQVEEPEEDEEPEGFSPRSWYTYNVPKARTKEEKRKKDDQRIREAIARQGENAPFDAMHPNAFDTEAALGYVTREEFESDFNDGDLDEDKYRMLDPDGDRRGDESVNRIVKFYREAYIHLESEYIDEDGDIRFDPNTEDKIYRYMANMGLRPEEVYVVFQQVIKELGFSPDRDNLFFNKENPEDAKIPDWVFCKALDNMYLSCLEYGHPYGFIDKSLSLGGTRCYPVGVMDMHEAEILCRNGAIFEGQLPLDLVNAAAYTWNNETYPDIRRDIYRQDKGYDQMIVLQDMVRAIASLDSISSRKYSISETVDRGYEQMQQEMRLKKNPDEDDKAVNERIDAQLTLRRDRIMQSKDRLDRKRNRVKYVWKEDIRDESGNIIHHRGDRIKASQLPDDRSMVEEKRNSVANPFSAACHFTANMARFMGVVGYAPIMGSALIEHAQGNINTIIANKILFGKDGAVYSPTAGMYDEITSEAGLEAISAMKALWAAGGSDAVILYYEYGDKVLNRESVSKFLNEQVKQQGSRNGKLAEFGKKAASRIDEWTRWLMPGDLGFAKADAKRWLESFMVGNRFNAKDPSGRFQSFTASEVAEMIDAMGIERFMAAAMDMQAGRDAMIMMRNQTLDRQSPISHQIDRILKASGVTDALVTLGIDTYFKYGFNLIQNFMPFSNTVSYLATKGINTIWTRNGRSDIDSLNYQLGGMDSRTFGAGLYKNLIYDIVKLGNIVAIQAFMSAILLALGFEEPEDPLNKYSWQEYRVGKNLNLGGTGEDGEPHGIPVYAAWWLNDLTLFGLPAAYAIASRTLDQKLVENDPDLSTKLFFDGCRSTLSGCSLFDLINSMARVKEDLATLDQMLTDDVEPPADWFSMAAMQAELFVAHGLGKFMPNMAKSILSGDLAFITGEKNFDRTAYKKYDRDSKTVGKTENVDDWFELQRRIESKYNPLYAIYNNWTKNHYLFDDGSTMETGYLLNEIPVATMKDQRSLYFVQRYSYPDEFDTMSEEDKDVIRMQTSEQIINDLQNDYGGNIELAIADGWTIPVEQRIYLGAYCEKSINYWRNAYADAVAAGIRGAEKEAFYNESKNAQSYYYNIKNNVVFNNDIPWTDEGYAKLKTNSYTVYQYKDTGKPATWWDYVWDKDNVEERFIPRGDLPNQIALFTTPHVDDDTGYNYEHTSKWFDENMTDLGKIFENGSGILELGRDAGVPLNTAIFGGSPNFATNEPIESQEYGTLESPTMGYRGYVDYDQDILKNLPNAIPPALLAGAAAGTAAAGAAAEGGSAVGSAVENGKAVSPLSYDYVFDTMKQEIQKIAGQPDAVFGEMGLARSGADGGNPSSSTSSGYRGGYSRSSYSSSRTSTRNPNIYASPRSLNTDKPATMYSKQLGSAKVNSYLSPGFSTKGSREAYRRQDI